jgi:hypothetical protein
MTANNAINADVQEPRSAMLLHAGYGGRYVAIREEVRPVAESSEF